MRDIWDQHHDSLLLHDYVTEAGSEREIPAFSDEMGEIAWTHAGAGSAISQARAILDGEAATSSPSLRVEITNRAGAVVWRGARRKGPT